MYSLHQKNLQDSKKKLKKERKTSQALTQKLASLREDRLINLAISTSPELIDRNIHSVMKTGVVPFTHSSAIEYREKPYKGNIYLRSYLPDTKRVQATITDYKNSHLEPGKYFKLRDDYLRESSYPFISDHRFESVSYRKKSQNSLNRVQTSIATNSGFLLNPIDKAHTFRDVKKNHWKSEVIHIKKDFLKYVKSVQEIKPGLNIGDKYTDGFDVVGDVKRKRVKELEVGGDFKLNFDKGTWEKTFKELPQSTRTFTTKSVLSRCKGEGKWYPVSFKGILGSRNEVRDSIS